MRENSLVQWLHTYPQPKTDHFPVGIGDDAAIMQWAGKDQLGVITTDLIADGTHFKLSECTATQIGRKAMAVNLSDVAAMACQPLAAFVSLLLPRGIDEAFTRELMSAAIELANSFGCVVSGGDTNSWDGKLAINVVVVGKATARGPLLRSHAKPGDSLLVTGKLGGSIQGHHLDFVPRIREALWLRENFEIHAGMDLSDGLAMDVRRLCRASGCGVEVVAEQLPLSDQVVRLDHEAAVRRALGDGEDFELLLAAPPAEAARIVEHPDLYFPVSIVGQCVEGDGLWLMKDQQLVELPEAGFEHR